MNILKKRNQLHIVLVCNKIFPYKPKWNTWLSVDPLAEKYPSWSTYNYTLQNPVKYTDPTGMVVEGGEGVDDHWELDDEPGGVGNVRNATSQIYAGFFTNVVRYLVQQGVDDPNRRILRSNGPSTRII